MPTATPTQTTSRPAQPRLLSGAGGGGSRAGERTRTTATEATTFTATIPFERPQARPGQTPAPATRTPRWLKGFVIGGVLLALGMPASVLLSRSMLVQEAMLEQSSSKAAMICTAGEGRALDDSSLVGWLFGGSYFHCGDWETREARVQRDRDQAQANFLARERAKQGLN